jgi:hypothetical protein
MHKVDPNLRQYAREFLDTFFATRKLPQIVNSSGTRVCYSVSPYQNSLHRKLSDSEVTTINFWQTANFFWSNAQGICESPILNNIEKTGDSLMHSLQENVYVIQKATIYAVLGKLYAIEEEVAPKDYPLFKQYRKNYQDFIQSTFGLQTFDSVCAEILIDGNCREPMYYMSTVHLFGYLAEYCPDILHETPSCCAYQLC